MKDARALEKVLRCQLEFARVSRRAERMPVAKMGKSDLFSEGGDIRKHFDEVVKPALEKSTQFSSLAGGWQRLERWWESLCTTNGTNVGNTF